MLAEGCEGRFGLGGPPSPQEIATKPSQSSMQDGHFKEKKSPQAHPSGRLLRLHHTAALCLFCLQYV